MAYLLTVETSAAGAEVTVHANADGLRALAARLEALARVAERGDRDHQHLQSEDWGGGELAGQSPAVAGGEWRNVHQLTIYAWPDRAFAAVEATGRDAERAPPAT